MRIDAVVSEAELNQQFRRKRVQFTDRNTAVCVVLIACREAAAVKKVREGTRSKDGLGFITETGEEVVLVRNFVVHTDVEIVLSQALLGVDEVVVSVDVDVWFWEQSCNPRGYRVDRAGTTAGKNIRGNAPAIHSDGHAAGRRSGGLRKARIENLSLVGWISAAIKLVWDRCAQIEKTGEVAPKHLRGGDQQEFGQRLPNAQPLVVHEEERTILPNGPAKRDSELVLLVGLPAEEIERVSAVQLVIAEELVQVAVEAVGAGLDDRIHDGTIAATEFRTIGISLCLEFADGVDGGLDHIRAAVQHVAQIGVVVDAVEQEVIL